MENNRERPQSHEDKEAQKLVNRVEQKQAVQDAAKAEKTRKTLDDYVKKVGSSAAGSQPSGGTGSPSPSAGVSRIGLNPPWARS